MQKLTRILFALSLTGVPFAQALPTGNATAAAVVNSLAPQLGDPEIAQILEEVRSSCGQTEGFRPALFAFRLISKVHGLSQNQLEQITQIAGSGRLCPSPSAAARTEDVETLHCRYQYMGTSLWDITYQFDESGQPFPSVVVSTQGREHKESLTPEKSSAPDERLHAWISKESAQNSIEVIIYRERRAEGLSKLINPHIPIGNEVWGECE
jgi:hypothetical protein